MTVSIDEVSAKTFDYVVAGGGTAGLFLAILLSEDPSVSVAVLEGGEANLNDDKITIPAQFAQLLGNPKYDWAYPTKEQKWLKDKVFYWNRGKCLGGTSALNLYAWIKPSAESWNAIEKLGNPGWNWLDFEVYAKQTETYHEPTPKQSAEYSYSYNSSYHGTSGLIQTMPVHSIPTLDSIVRKTLVNKGVKEIPDPCGGDICGIFNATASLDPKTWRRSYAGSVYYQHRDRPNLTVLTQALVSRVIFSDESFDSELTATGLDFLFDGKVHKVYAKKEVVLSTGTPITPKILELSGIGQAEHLRKIGVDVKIDLPGVGENVQDHCFTGVSFELDPKQGYVTYDRMFDPEFAAEQRKLFEEGKEGMQRLGLNNFAYPSLSHVCGSEKALAHIRRVTEEIEALKEGGKLTPIQIEQYELQLQLLWDDGLPDLELLAFPGFFTTVSKSQPGKSYLTILVVTNHPFSRGTVHAKSSDPLEYPEIDPHYLEVDADLENMVEQLKFVIRLTSEIVVPSVSNVLLMYHFYSLKETEPFKSVVVDQIDPSIHATTDEELRDYIYKSYNTAWHAVGSTSMLPREKGGVVDANLRVYGTKNLRIADLGIIPIHFSGHTQTSAYVIAAKAADIVRQAN